MNSDALVRGTFHLPPESQFQSDLATGSRGSVPEWAPTLGCYLRNPVRVAGLIELPAHITESYSVRCNALRWFHLRFGEALRHVTLATLDPLFLFAN